MAAQLQAIAWCVPDGRLTNDELARDYADWPAEKIQNKTGISNRFIAKETECASDLAYRAAQQLLGAKSIRASEIDFVLLCTQSPDYFLPTTACLLQHRLGIPTTAGALDFNLGCSGFVYGLGLAAGLVESNQARNVLLLTAETYTKYIRPHDRNVRTIFGDGAAAALISRVATKTRQLGPFVYGTDGSGAENLIVRNGGFRHPCQTGPETAPVLFMNGPEIFSFTLRTVPNCLYELLKRAHLNVSDVDQFIFHQANGYMLKHLQQKCDLPSEKFFIGMRDCGNTVSSSIPIALAQASHEGRIKAGDTVVVIGFGVGYSWAGTVIQWAGNACDDSVSSARIGWESVTEDSRVGGDPTHSTADTWRQGCDG